MPAPLITALPVAPSRADDGATFSTKADAFIAALPEFVSDANAQALYLDGLAQQITADKNSTSQAAQSASGYRDESEGFASDAGESAGLAQAFAAQAIAGAGPIGPIHMNPNEITSDLTIPSGFNAVSVGEMTTALGVTVTVELGAVYTTL